MEDVLKPTELVDLLMTKPKDDRENSMRHTETVRKKKSRGGMSRFNERIASISPVVLPSTQGHNIMAFITCILNICPALLGNLPRLPM